MTQLIARITILEFPQTLTAEGVETFLTSPPTDDVWRQGVPGQVYGFTLWDGRQLMFVALWDGRGGLDATDKRYRESMNVKASEVGARVVSIRRWSVRQRWLDPFLMAYMRLAPGARRDPFPFDDAFVWLDKLKSDAST